MAPLAAALALVDVRPGLSNVPNRNYWKNELGRRFF